MELLGGALRDVGEEGAGLIFATKPVDLERIRLAAAGPGTGPPRVVGVAAGNGSLLAAFQGGDVARWFPIEDEVSPIDFGRERCTDVRRLLLEPKGLHALATNSQGDSWYLNLDGKARPLSKLKGHIVESVSWDPDSTEACTRDLIIGTGAGQLLHVVIEGKERSVKPLFAFEHAAGGEQRRNAVCGVQRDRILGVDGAERMVIFVAVGRGLYAFVGPSLDCLFQKYQGDGAMSRALVFEVPGESPRSDLQVAPRCVGSSASKVLFWLTGVGVLAAQIQSRLDAEGTLLEKPPGLIPFPRSPKASGRDARRSGGLVASLLPEPPPSAPLRMALTAYHVIFLYEDRWAAVSRITHEVVQHQEWDTALHGPLRGLASDLSQDMLWLHAEGGLFALSANGEDRDVWRLLMKLEQFQDALLACKTPQQSARVLAAHAKWLFAKGRYVDSAQKFAEATTIGVESVPFEHVMLRFFNARCKEATLEYLRCRLRLCPVEDKVCRTLLGTWVVEVCLARLNELQLTAQSCKGRAALDQERARLQELLRSCQDLDAHRLVYHLLQSHGWLDDLVFFAEARRDFETVTLHHVSRGEHASAIRKLDDFAAAGAGESLVRRFGPALFWAEPKALVSLLLRPQLGKMDPLCALPSVYRPQASPAHRAQALRYLEQAARHHPELLGHVPQSEGGSLERTPPQGGALPPDGAQIVGGAQDVEVGASADGANPVEASHGWASRAGFVNALFVLYAEGASTKGSPEGAPEEAEETLMRFLAEHEASPFFDPGFALRVCSEHGLTRAETLLFSSMGMHVEAVDLALGRGDVGLAKHAACRPADQKLRHRLWLRVVQHEAMDGDMQKVVDLIRESGELSVRDVLPLLPESATIEAFHRDICECLDSYEDQILTLRQEMDDHRRALKAFKEDLKHAEEQCVTIPEDALCEICGALAVRERFYAFSCAHCFHEACLRALMLPALAAEGQDARLIELEAARLEHQAVAAGASSATPAATLAEVEDELDSILADDCPLCGRLMIDTIKRPFVDAVEEAEVESWAIK